MKFDSYREKFTIGSHWLLPVTVTAHQECEPDDLHPTPVQIKHAGEPRTLWLEPATLNALLDSPTLPARFREGDVVEAVELAARSPRDILSENAVAVHSRWVVVKEDPNGWVDLTHLSGDDNFDFGDAASIAFPFLRLVLPAEEAQPFFITSTSETLASVGTVVHWFVIKSPSTRLACFTAIPNTGLTPTKAREEAARLAADLNAAHLSQCARLNADNRKEQQ